MSHRIAFFLLAISLFDGCAGYTLRSRDNPFAQYGISKIAIPQFYNQSNLNGVARHFTREFTLLLQSFNGLEVVTGDDPTADAHLIGILKSPQYLHQTMSRNHETTASTYNPALTQERQDILIPTSNRIDLRLSLILIRNPEKEDIELLQSSIGEQITKGKKIIFQEQFSAGGSINLEIYRGDNSIVNSAQNRGILEKTMIQRAQTTAIAFKNRVLYVF